MHDDAKHDAPTATTADGIEYELLHMLPRLQLGPRRPRALALGPEPDGRGRSIYLLREVAPEAFEPIGPPTTVEQASATAELVLAGHQRTITHPTTLMALALALLAVVVEDERIQRIDAPTAGMSGRAGGEPGGAQPSAPSGSAVPALLATGGEA